MGDSWEVKKRGDRSLVHCKTHFGQNPQISHIFFFLKHFFVDPSPDFVLRSQSYAVEDLGTGLPPLLTPSLDYLWLPLFLSQRKLHCSCLKPLVLSNVVQGGSLSASTQNYNCSLKNPALMDKIMWSVRVMVSDSPQINTCPLHPLSIKFNQQILRLSG